MNRRQFLWTAGSGTGLVHVLQSQDTELLGQTLPKENAPKEKEGQPEGPVVSAPFSPVQIGTSAQLFVERSIIRETERVWFTLHPGEKHPRNPLIRADRDWEGWRIRCRNAIFDEDEKVFKMWYSSEPTPAGFGQKGSNCYYAVSKDGVEWEKPLVGTIESPTLGLRHNAVFRGEHLNAIKDYDERDPARRYKALCSGGSDPEIRRPKNTFVSPDGFHWTQFSPKSVVRDASDVLTAYYDEQRRVWVSFVKKRPKVRGQLRRSFCLMYSKDFVHWSDPQFVFVPDYDDDAGSWRRIESVRPILEAPDNPLLVRTEIYGVGAYAAESCTVAFPWIFSVNNDVEGGGNQGGPIEIQLAASRDLVNWQRHFRIPCVSVGRVGEWDSGLFCTQSKAIPHNDEVWLYFSASNCTHGYEGFDPKQPNKMSRDKTFSIGLVKWKLDRFVSADAGSEGGVLTTVPFTYTGSRLELNARVQPGGSIRAEFLDAAGRPIEGAGLSTPCTGDSLRSRVAWAKNVGIVDRLKGKPVSLRFHFRSAELYSFAFRS